MYTYTDEAHNKNYSYHFRLAVNYVESETGEEKLDDLHSGCSIQFTGKVIVPTKDVLSKIILALNQTLKRKRKCG